MAGKQKFYVVWKGRRPGIYDNWEKASAQVNGFQGAQYKSFDTRPAAEAAFRSSYSAYVAPHSSQSLQASQASTAGRWKQAHFLGIDPPITPSYCADASAIGNPGPMEYRAVHTETGELLFASPVYPEGTNNIGEFLAIVETLMALRQRDDPAPVYSDSVNALSWVKQKKCKTQQTKNARNAALFDRIARAELFLRVTAPPNKLLKWRTEDWGEIPADYGRK